MAKQKVPAEVSALARQAGYDLAVFEHRWRGFAVYSARNNGQGKWTPPCIGEPFFILYANSEARPATDSEMFAFLAEAPEAG